MTQDGKTPIQSCVQRGEKTYAPFMPIIAYLQEQGAEFANGTSQARPFLSTPNGSECYLKIRFDIADLRKVFDFPDQFEFGVPYPNCIWDRNYNVKLCISG